MFYQPLVFRTALTFLLTCLYCSTLPTEYFIALRLSAILMAELTSYLWQNWHRNSCYKRLKTLYSNHPETIINYFVTGLTHHKHSNQGRVLSWCTGSQELIQQTHQCSTAKQSFVKKGVQWLFPLRTGTPGHNPGAGISFEYWYSERFTTSP